MAEALAEEALFSWLPSLFLLPPVAGSPSFPTPRCCLQRPFPSPSPGAEAKAEAELPPVVVVVKVSSPSSFRLMTPPPPPSVE